MLLVEIPRCEFKNARVVDTLRCVPNIMVKIKGLDCFLRSIRRRVKHVGCFSFARPGFVVVRVRVRVRLGLVWGYGGKRRGLRTWAEQSGKYFLFLEV